LTFDSKKQPLQNNELLYRRIPDKPSHYTTSKGKIILSSAVFKDPRGISGQRQGDRTNATVCQKLNRDFPDHGLLSMTTQACTSAGATIKITPSNASPYHIDFANRDGSVKIDTDIVRLLLLYSNQEYKPKSQR